MVKYYYTWRLDVADEAFHKKVIAEVSEATGYSELTIELIIKGDNAVIPEVRDDVLEELNKKGIKTEEFNLGKPDIKSNIIAVCAAYFSSAFMSEVMHGIERKVRDTGYKLFQFSTKGNPEYDYYEPINGIVIIMCGLQASGKDWTIKNKFPEWKVISLDQTRIDMDLDFGDDEPSVIQEAKEQCKILMRSKTNFVFNATNIVKDVRTRWISLFRQYKYKVIIYYKERPLKTILEANRQREYSVPEDVILEKVKKIDIPTEMECHDLILDVN